MDKEIHLLNISTDLLHKISLTHQKFRSQVECQKKINRDLNEEAQRLSFAKQHQSPFSSYRYRVKRIRSHAHFFLKENKTIRDLLSDDKKFILEFQNLLLTCQVDSNNDESLLNILEKLKSDFVPIKQEHESLCTTNFEIREFLHELSKTKY